MSMKWIRPFVIVLLPMLLAGLGSVVGCSPRVNLKAGEISSPTGGVAIMYDERNFPAQSFRRYELDSDGTLRVGGGRAAQAGTTTWSGTPSPEDLEAILSAVKAARFLDGEPACEPALVDGEESIATTIEYVAPNGSTHVVLSGRCPTLMPLRAAFEQAARARFKQQIDALPEPGLQKKATSGAG
ncbi:MAG: hypothetical protein SGJ09_17275 [Phycisphaerae bacterium]|nr:hypothetical protein [Phycisphaerae bacterium]